MVSSKMSGVIQNFWGLAVSTIFNCKTHFLHQHLQQPLNAFIWAFTSMDFQFKRRTRLHSVCLTFWLLVPCRPKAQWVSGKVFFGRWPSLPAAPAPDTIMMTWHLKSVIPPPPAPILIQCYPATTLPNNHFAEQTPDTSRAMPRMIVTRMKQTTEAKHRYARPYKILIFGACTSPCSAIFLK